MKSAVKEISKELFYKEIDCCAVCRKLRGDWWKAKLCTACVSPLGRILSRGGHCPQCGLRVCKNCRYYDVPNRGGGGQVSSSSSSASPSTSQNQQNWICILCSGSTPNFSSLPKSTSIGKTTKSIRRSWTISNPQRGQNNSPVLKSYTVYSDDNTATTTTVTTTTGNPRQFNSLPRLSYGIQDENQPLDSALSYSTLYTFKTHKANSNASVNFIEDPFWDYYDYNNIINTNSNRSSCERSLGETESYTYIIDPEDEAKQKQQQQQEQQQRQNQHHQQQQFDQSNNHPPVKPERSNKRSNSLNSYDGKKLSFSPLRTYVVLRQPNHPQSTPVIVTKKRSSSFNLDSAHNGSKRNRGDDPLSYPSQNPKDIISDLKRPLSEHRLHNLLNSSSSSKPRKDFTNNEILRQSQPLESEKLTRELHGFFTEKFLANAINNDSHVSENHNPHSHPLFTSQSLPKRKSTTIQFYRQQPELPLLSSSSNAPSKLPKYFHSELPNENDDAIQITHTPPLTTSTFPKNSNDTHRSAAGIVIKPPRKFLTQTLCTSPPRTPTNSSPPPPIITPVVDPKLENLLRKSEKILNPNINIFRIEQQPPPESHLLSQLQLQRPTEFQTFPRRKHLTTVPVIQDPQYQLNDGNSSQTHSLDRRRSSYPRNILKIRNAGSGAKVGLKSQALPYSSGSSSEELIAEEMISECEDDDDDEEDEDESEGVDRTRGLATSIADPLLGNVVTVGGGWVYNKAAPPSPSSALPSTQPAVINANAGNIRTTTTTTTAATTTSSSSTITSAAPPQPSEQVSHEVVVGSREIRGRRRGAVSSNGNISGYSSSGKGSRSNKLTDLNSQYAPNYGVIGGGGDGGSGAGYPGSPRPGSLLSSSHNNNNSSNKLRIIKGRSSNEFVTTVEINNDMCHEPLIVNPILRIHDNDDDQYEREHEYGSKSNHKNKNDDDNDGNNSSGGGTLTPIITSPQRFERIHSILQHQHHHQAEPLLSQHQPQHLQLQHENLQEQQHLQIHQNHQQLQQHQQHHKNHQQLHHQNQWQQQHQEQKQDQHQQQQHYDRQEERDQDQQVALESVAEDRGGYNSIARNRNLNGEKIIKIRPPSPPPPPPLQESPPTPPKRSVLGGGNNKNNNNGNFGDKDLLLVYKSKSNSINNNNNNSNNNKSEVGSEHSGSESSSSSELLLGGRTWTSTTTEENSSDDTIIDFFQSEENDNVDDDDDDEAEETLRRNNVICGDKKDDVDDDDNDNEQEDNDIDSRSDTLVEADGIVSGVTKNSGSGRQRRNNNSLSRLWGEQQVEISQGSSAPGPAKIPVESASATATSNVAEKIKELIFGESSNTDNLIIPTYDAPPDPPPTETFRQLLEDLQQTLKADLTPKSPPNNDAYPLTPETIVNTVEIHPGSDISAPGIYQESPPSNAPSLVSVSDEEGISQQVEPPSSNILLNFFSSPIQDNWNPHNKSEDLLQYLHVTELQQKQQQRGRQSEAGLDQVTLPQIPTITLPKDDDPPARSSGATTPECPQVPSASPTDPIIIQNIIPRPQIMMEQNERLTPEGQESYTDESTITSASTTSTTKRSSPDGEEIQDVKMSKMEQNGGSVDDVVDDDEEEEAFQVTSSDSDNSWVEEIPYEEGPPPLDLTLHTIVEESCEESCDESIRSIQMPRKTAPDALENYFNYLDPGSETADMRHRRLANEDSEFSDTFSESSFNSEVIPPMMSQQQQSRQDEDDDPMMDPVDLASTRLEKYFTNLSYARDGRAQDSEDSVGSESECDDHVKDGKKKVLKHKRSANVSDDESIFDQDEGAFDTIKKGSKKKSAAAAGEKSCEQDSSAATAAPANAGPSMSTMECDNNRTSGGDDDGEAQPRPKQVLLDRSNSFQWSSDEEVNLMMSKLRHLIKNLMQRSQAAPSESNSQLRYFETELIRLMRAEPELKNIVSEYISSEESDDNEFNQFIKDVVTQEEKGNGHQEGGGKAGSGLEGGRRGRGDVGGGSLLGQNNSPALIAKVMHHIGNRLSVWMKDEEAEVVDEGGGALKCAPSVSSDLNEDRFSWKGSFESTLAAKRQSVGSTDSISSSDLNSHPPNSGVDRSILRSSSLHHLANSQPIEEKKEEEENISSSLPKLNQVANMSRAQSLIGIKEKVKSARYRPPGFTQAPSIIKQMDDKMSMSTPALHQDNSHAHPSDTPLNLRSSADSISSMFESSMMGRISIRGQIEFGLQYNYKLAALEVRVKQCRDLAAVDAKRNRSDPYVKAYLLPDRSKGGKRKTKTKKNTLSPVFEETLKFPVSLSELQSRTLWLSVWHNDIFGKNEFLGQVIVGLKDRVFDDPSPIWWSLEEMSVQADDQPLGDLVLALKWQPRSPATGNLSVLVKEAKNLLPTKNGCPSTFVKCCPLKETKYHRTKQKTSIARRTLHPIWNQTLYFEDIPDDGVEVSLWNYDLLSNHDLVGSVRLDCDNPLWESMLNRHSFWVEGGLKLEHPHPTT